MNEISFLSLDSLKFGDLAVFAGAGISKNSGLPLADELKERILGKLSVDTKDIEETMESNFPFEAFMEVISENTDISKILDIFQNGEPNTNHILITRLAKNGYLKTIFTTNFDLLIEEALEREGLIRDKDFKIYYHEEQFSRIGFKDIKSKIIRIIKIHGSIDNKHSIRTTMKAVASKTLSDKRMNVIKYLFSTGKHNKVLILGYSCSDDFDITPQIKSIEKNQKEIIFIEHSIEDSEEIEEVKTKNFKNPFKKFPGKRIKCNTDKAIRNLWESFKAVGILRGEYEGSKSEVAWKEYIDDWAKGLGKNRKYLEYRIPGLILYRMSSFSKTVEYHKKALEIAEALGSVKKKSTCHTSLGNSFYGLGDFKRAAECYEKSLEINTSIEDGEGKSACYTNLGVAYDHLRNFRRAIEYFERALEIEKTIGDRVREAACYGGLGSAYNGLEDFKRGIEYSEKGLEIARTIGDKEREVKCYIGLGNAYNGLKNFKGALENFERALEIAKAIVDKVGEAACYGGLGSAYNGLEDFKRGIEYSEKGLETEKAIGRR